MKGLADLSLLALIVCPDGSTAQETGDRGIPSNRSDLLPQSQRDGESRGREWAEGKSIMPIAIILPMDMLLVECHQVSTADTCTWRAMLLCDRVC